MTDYKKRIEDKLGDALHELRTRCSHKSTKLSEIQRIYGFILGLRVALMQFDPEDPYNWKYHEDVLWLLAKGFGQLTLKEIREIREFTFRSTTE